MSDFHGHENGWRLWLEDAARDYCSLGDAKDNCLSQ